MKNLRILLVDDHELVRSGLRVLLKNMNFEVVAEAKDGFEALKLIASLHPDVVLMDVAMPGMNGLEATVQASQKYPKTRIIILSMHINADYARRALHAGAKGYLPKGASAAELEMAVNAVANDNVYLCPSIAKLLVDNFIGKDSIQLHLLDQLSRRQREILQLIAEGNSRKEIAQKLHISVKTFDTHRAQLMKQLGIHSNAGMVHFAVDSGIIQKS